MEKQSPWPVTLLLLPGIGYLTLFFGIPVSWSVWGSFQGSGDGGLSLEYYTTIFTNKLYRDGLFFSLYLALVPLVTSLAISIPLAALLQKDFHGKSLFMVLYKIPLVVPSIVAALMVMLMLDRGGMSHRIADMAGMGWPRMIRDPWAIGAIVTSTWKNVPFMTLIIGGSMASINKEILHAGRLLGATWLSVFTKIQVPLALPGITAATLLTFIGSMGGFCHSKPTRPSIPITALCTYV